MEFEAHVCLEDGIKAIKGLGFTVQRAQKMMVI
jgi:hypothetical protein